VFRGRRDDGERVEIKESSKTNVLRSGLGVVVLYLCHVRIDQGRSG
jgi:hypothetical protein